MPPTVLTLADEVIETGCRLLRCTGRYWHVAAFAPPRNFGRKRGIAEVDGQPPDPNGDARDPTATLAVHCGMDLRSVSALIEGLV